MLGNSKDHTHDSYLPFKACKYQLIYYIFLGNTTYLEKLTISTCIPGQSKEMTHIAGLPPCASTVILNVMAWQPLRKRGVSTGSKLTSTADVGSATSHCEHLKFSRVATEEQPRRRKTSNADKNRQYTPCRTKRSEMNAMSHGRGGEDPHTASKRCRPETSVEKKKKK
jgi:hypothetical protein